MTHHTSFSGNSHSSWPFIKPTAAASAPVIVEEPAKAPQHPYPALHALFVGDKSTFEAFLHVAACHVQCMDPFDLQVKSKTPFEAAPQRIPVKDFAGDKACRIAALRNAIPEAVKKVYHGRGSHGFRNYISLAAAKELEEVAATLKAA